MAALTIYRGEEELVTVKITDNTVYSCNLMAEDKVMTNFQLPQAFGFAIGDYIIHKGQRYTLNVVPVESKLSSRLFDYELEFEGPAYTLYNKLYQDEGASIFNYFGTPNEFLLLLLTNINSLDSGWTIGDVEDLEPDSIDFDGENCRQALTKIADHFGLEYIIRGKEITMLADIGETVAGLSLSYGKGNGLYTLKRERIDDEKLVTRLYGFGSSENLPVDYRDGVGRLTFEERYVDLNTELYGIREGIAIFDDIKPSFGSAVTGVNVDSEFFDREFFIYDSSLSITGAEWRALLIGNLVPRIVFTSGSLNGNEFEIIYYSGTATVDGIPWFWLRPRTELNGYILPNPTVKPEIGDTYTIVNIGQDISLMSASEATVKAATEDAIIDIATPKARYSLEIDEKYVRNENIADDLLVGNRVAIVDADLGIDRAIRLQSISYPLAVPERVTATLSDIVSYTIAEKLLTGQARLLAIGARIDKRNIIFNINTQKQVETVHKQINDPAFDNVIAYDNLKVGSPDHYFQARKILLEDEEANPYDYMPTFIGTSINKGVQIIGDPTNELLEKYAVVGREGYDGNDIIIAAGATSLEDEDIYVSPFSVRRDGYLRSTSALLGDLKIEDGQIAINNVGTGAGVAYKEDGNLNLKSWKDTLDISITSNASELSATLLPSVISSKDMHTTPSTNDELMIYDHVADELKKVKMSDLGGSKWADGSGTGYGGTITGIVRDSYVTIGQAAFNSGWKLFVKSSFNGNSDFNAQGIMRLEYASGEIAYWVKGRQTQINAGLVISTGSVNLTGLSAQYVYNVAGIYGGNSATLNLGGQQIAFLVQNVNQYMFFKVYNGSTYEDIIRARFVTGGNGKQIGFLGANDVPRQNVIGSKGGNAALASLITAMENFGLITDSTT